MVDTQPVTNTHTSVHSQTVIILSLLIPGFGWHYNYFVCEQNTCMLYIDVLHHVLIAFEKSQSQTSRSQKLFIGMSIKYAFI